MTTAGAIFSPDRTKRIVLWRRWGKGDRFALCIGLNPSTANETSNDKTIAFLVKLLQSRGYDGFKMCNLFTDITPRPSELPAEKSKQDLQTLVDHSKGMTDVIFCWGTFKEAKERAKEIIDANLFPNAKCLGINLDSTPKHPAWYIRNGFVNKKIELIPINHYKS